MKLIPLPAAQTEALLRENLRVARRLCPDGLSPRLLSHLRHLTESFCLSFRLGDFQLLSGGWYVRHLGLIRIATRNRCLGIRVQTIREFCDMNNNRWTFRAIVFRSRTCKGFVGYGDADPSNVSPFLRGAEMRVAETRAVNRALRKAYGIGICSIEEIGSFAEPAHSYRESKKLPPQNANGNYGGPRVRDRLCQIIRQHQLDANLVKAYATDLCVTQAPGKQPGNRLRISSSI